MSTDPDGAGQAGPTEPAPIDADAPMATGDAFFDAYDNPRLGGTIEEGDRRNEHGRERD